MKKFILFLVASIACIHVYANTCEYDGVKITLKREQVTVPPGNRYVQGKAILAFSSNKPVKSPRVEIRAYDSRGNMVYDRFITLEGHGGYDFFCEIPMPEGTYTFKLVEKPGQCY